MASTCPSCGKKLKFYNVKAECSSCGANIPNYNWEERLEEDNANADKAFESFYRNMNRLKYCLFGTKLRIARLIITFLPAIGFILPWYTINSEGSSLSLTAYSLFNSNVSLVDVIISFFGSSSSYFANFSFESSSGAVTFGMLGMLFFVLSALFIVVAYLLVLFTFKRPKTSLCVSFDVLSVASAIVSVVMMFFATSAAKDEVAFSFGNNSFINATGSVSWGFFVALALLVIALVVNVIIFKKPAKSDETLEDERLAKKAVKEEKERKDEERKIKAREEAAKKQEEEEKEKVAAAKAHMAQVKAKQEEKNNK